MTPEQYHAMFALQNGVCAICKTPSSKRLAIDHDHKTQKVRGLLCIPCNLAIGNLKDSAANAISVAGYLLKWQASVENKEQINE